MKTRLKAQGSAGFTLIEVMIAVVIMLTITLLISRTMSAAIATKQRSEKRARVYRAADLVLNRMTRELATGVLYGSLDFLGVSGSSEQMTKSVFIGTNSGDQDKLTFDTFSHVRYLKNSKESDLAEVTYFLESSRDQEGEEDEEAAPGQLVLKLREKSPLDNSPDQGGKVMILMEGVRELNFRYYDPVKNEYQDEWDTTKIDHANRLPRAVEITLVLQDPIDEDNTVRLQTVALLEMSPGPNDF